MVKAGVDMSGWLEGLAKLGGPLKESLARSMGVAGGQVIRDEAKLQAPVDDGTLQDAIYLVFKDGKSDEHQVTYSVTWNKKKAPHGHLQEFGHWQPYVTVKLPNGEWITTKQLLPSPKWIPANPFLRPAFDAAAGRAQKAMVDRGRERLPELLAGMSDEVKE